MFVSLIVLVALSIVVKAANETKSKVRHLSYKL
jgi:hypothetical protein